MRCLLFGTFILVIPSLFIQSCKKSDSPTVFPVKSGNISISFNHLDQNSNLIFDTLNHITSKGYHYMINDLQYFISGVRFHRAGGNWLPVTTDEGIHYVDVRANTGTIWQLKDEIPEGLVDSVSFIFGLDAQNNISNRFVNPPERDMFWPDILGGGYHYMKIDMKYSTVSNPAEQVPFMFHLGIGQMYMGTTMDPDSIIGYIQNYFQVAYPLSIKISPDATQNFTIIMSVDKWFDGVYAFDFDSYPMSIMQSQQGLFEACRNGRNVFSIAK